MNIAKTYKVIGTLYMIDNPPKPQEAKEYLLRAQSIFEQKGLQKMLKEVKEKVKLINRQMKSGGPILGQGGATAEADNIIEESAYDSNNEQMNPQLEQQQPNQHPLATNQIQPHLQH